MPYGRAGLPDGLPHGAAVARRHVDLEAELAGEAHPEQPAPARRRSAPPRTAMCGSAPAARSSAADEGREHCSRARGPCTAMTAHCSVTEVSQTCEVGPLGLEIVLHHVRARAARRRSWW